MKLNAFGDVCLRTLMLLGSRPAEQRTSREIAEAIGVPYHHVTKAVLELRRRGAVDVARGRAGGATISPRGLQLSVGELLRSLDEQLDVVDCTTGDTPCPLLAGCRLRVALRRAREAFYAELDPLTVHDLSATTPAQAVNLLPPQAPTDSAR
ncbi:RrF2 family transcriptional regulator [Zhihengliuella flava]|uniref:Rrf2 family nitric oxide-sensitive transcriptional repressor n=1 Tax=Zhihengliuella flava TaxID=1285193 RepID=A0A931DCZ4_9MICC|nr:Rrf2 family transcriptional regulator [Zhihengliuella flava]MBG6085181.1 Rrf2 family nitric oxide-sensitive transcriptional repressor [Zhihengliuella flava]